MPTVFHAITDENVGGAGVFLCDLLSHSKKNRGSPVLLPEGSLLCERLSAYDIPFLEHPLRGMGRDALCYRRILKTRGASLVVSHASVAAKAAAKSLGIPTVSVKHCDLPISPVLVPLYNALTDATVATSRAAARHLREAGIKRVLTIENGFTPVGAPTPLQRAAARAKLSLPQGALLLGLSGRLSPIKGHACAIRALARLGEGNEPVLLCFLGEGEEREHLRALAKALGVSRRVCFLGFSADPVPFYHAIDLHLSCSLGSETSSLSLAEGMSAGCVTVASDTEGNRERVGDGGLLFPTGDAAALAACIQSLSKEKRQSLSHLALLRASRLPRWDEVARAYDALFDAFCGELGQNGCIFPRDMI